ncbi:MAG: Flp pilus assembly complex ATPase component TadA [Nitrospinae bacterium]|nr:Flp pilus assembly complex ATPase component TadA [Nitrospinota bacterium]
MKSYLRLKHYAGKGFKEKYSYKYWKSWQGRYLKGNNIGRGNLQSIVKTIDRNSLSTEGALEVNNIANLAFSDLIWDQVVSIEKFDYNGYVYDFSVPKNESFVCENIVAHNTRELQLPKFLYWAPLTVRPPNPEGKGEVTMLDLLVNSLRMRPDRIILGEIRKKDQAQVLFEAMHTGHSVYATVHADSISETIRRLVNPPINVPQNLLTAVNLNVVMFRDRRKRIRRVYQIGEYIGSEEGREIRPNILYRWNPTEDIIVPHSKSLRLLDDLNTHTGMSQQEITNDLIQKEKILKSMVKKNIRSVDDVGDIFNKYYTNQDNVFKK